MARLLEGITLVDDLDVSIDPDTYPDQASPAPPMAGTYNFRIKSLNIRKDKEGNIVLKDEQYPTFVLEQVEIVEPEDLARTVALYQDISTKPFLRNGKPATIVGDLVRSLDQTASAAGLLEIDALLAQAVDQKTTFRARLDWECYDSAFAKAALEEAGLGGVRYADMDEDEKKVANAIYKSAKLQGMKNFPKLENGKHNHLWVGPSGETIEARPVLRSFYPSQETVRLVKAA